MDKTPFGSFLYKVKRCIERDFSEQVDLIANNYLLEPLSVDFAVDFDKELYGLVDNEGREVLPMEYESIGHVINGYAVVKASLCYGIIDEKGNLIIPCKYFLIHAFSCGLFCAYNGNCWGYLDEKGAVAIPFKFRDATSFVDNYAAVNVFVEELGNQKWTIIDKGGKEIFPLIYNWIHIYNKNLIAVKEKEIRFVNIYNQVVIEESFSEIKLLHDKILVKRSDRWFNLNNDGHKVETDLLFDFLHSNEYHPKSLTTVSKNKKLGLIDKEGNLLAPCEYDEIDPFKEGLARVNKGIVRFENLILKGGKYGFINESGKEVISCRFDYASAFSDGLSAICIGGSHSKWSKEPFGGKWGYIDSKGNEVISPRYENATLFKNGTARVSYDGKYFIIDKQGNIIENM